MKKHFYLISFLLTLFISFISLAWPGILWSFVFIGPLILLGIYDILQRKHTVWRNFPVVGHLRYVFEAIRPEIQQYFIEADWSGRPLNRMHRVLVYARAKGELATVPYGTQANILEPGHEWLKHSIASKHVPREHPRVTVGNDQCKKPYSASIFNISAMSFGAISKNAVMALNRGAKLGNFYHNTGEGGISPYHLKYEGDLVYQIGTGYFGCRKGKGKFCKDTFKEKAKIPSIKMIELKLSQGAKPGYGGILPAKKLTQEICDIRGVEFGKDVISPQYHTTFSTPIGLLEYLAMLRDLSGGKPVGIKLCIGSKREFLAICKAMLKTGIYPDFITVDGSEGGTGAAPLEFAAHVGMPLIDALPFVHSALVGTGLRKHVKIIAAGKLITAFHVVAKIAVGADICNNARGMMLAIGCIQSLRCNTNRCPTGVTTQDPSLVYGLVVNEKYKRVASYHQQTINRVLDLVGAASRTLIFIRTKTQTHQTPHQSQRCENTR